MRAVIGCMLVFFAAFCLVACQSAASGPRFAEKVFDINNRALVYVYSDYGSTGISTPGILVDGKKVGDLAGSGYLFYEITSGNHTIQVPKSMTWDIKTPSLQFEAKAGEQYFVKYIVYPVGSDVYPNGIIDTKFFAKLELVRSTLGLSEISTLKLSN